MFEYTAKVNRVIDGDTIDATVDLGFSISITERFRLFGIDAPEPHSSNENERILAKRSTERLRELVEGCTVTIKTHKPDKYGRWLAEIKTSDNILGTVNAQLIAEGFAKQYFGIGDRPTWS